MKHISIDLGTSNTVISEKNKGVILNQPSVVAIDLKNKQVVAVGVDAKALLDRAPMDICVTSPIKNGIISDFDITCAMLRCFLDIACPKSAIRPKATVCIPQGLTEVEKHMLAEVVSRSGAKSAYTQDTSLSSALGTGIDIKSPVGNMILDVGGGKTTVSVVSFGGVVVSKSSSYAGQKMDDCIIEYIKENCGILLGRKTAEDIKIKIGSAHAKDPERSVFVTGRDATSGLPREIEVKSSDVREAIYPVLIKIAEVIKAVLSQTPPELTCDLMQRGMVMCGGASNLTGLDKFIEETVRLPAHLCENPFECASLGGCEVVGKGI